MQTTALRRFTPAVGVLAGGVLVALAVDAVRASGRYLPVEAIETDYLWGLVYAFGLGISIQFWPVPDEDRVHLTRLWVVKCFMALVLMLFYEWFYIIDSSGYFLATLDPIGRIRQMGIGRGTQNLFGTTAIIGLVLPHSFHALKVAFAFIGFIAIYVFYRASVHFLGKSDPRFFYALGLFPSVLFWSSTIGKDPLQMLGIALYVHGMVAWIRTKQMRFVASALVGLALSMFIRIWSGAILLAPLIVFPLVGARGLFRRGVLLAGVMGILVLVASQLSDIYKFETAEELLAQTEKFAGSEGWAGGSQVSGRTELTSFGAVAKAAPLAMFTALFRPLPGEVNHIFGLLAGLENALLFGLLVYAVFNATGRRVRDPVILAGIVLVLLWSLLYGLVVFNLGALARFKLQIQPLMLLLLLYLSTGPKRRHTAVAHTAE